MKSVVLAVLALTLALPSTAAATTITVRTTSSPKTLTIALGGPTRVTLSLVGTDVYVAGLEADTFPGTTGCTAVTGGLNCGSGHTRIVFTGSGGNDELLPTPTIATVIEAHGGGGSDELNGAAGADVIDGDAGADTLRGGDGNDTLRGGTENDVITGDLGTDSIDGGTGADTLFGAGDTLDFTTRTTPVSVDLGAGTTSDGDSLFGFTTVFGGTGADTLIGTDAAERLEGRDGNDTLVGGAGNDTLQGGRGNDVLNGGPGADSLSGNEDADFLDTRDATVDSALSCGPGSDRLNGDLADPATTDCEVIAPTVLGDIAITGVAAEGGTLYAAFSGRVTGMDSTRAWRWSRCGAAGCVLVGEDSAYTPTAADAGALLVVTLRAANDAGIGELASAGIGPVVGIPVPVPVAAVVTPPAVPPAAAAAATVSSVRCAGKRCRVGLKVTGAAASVKAVLTRAGKTVASATKRAPKPLFTLNVDAKRTLRKGTYKLKVTVTGADKRTQATTRTVRIR